MNHILVGPWNQQAWAGKDKSGAWPGMYRMGHVCMLVLGWAHLSNEQDSKIWPGHGQRGVVLDSLKGWLLTEFDLYALLNSCSRCDCYLVICPISMTNL